MLSVLLTTKTKKFNKKKEDLYNFNTKNHEEYAKSTIGFEVIHKYL